MSKPRSRSTFTITAELLIERAAPRKIASVGLQPIRVAISYPRAIINMISMTPIKTMRNPIRLIRCHPKSKPRAKSSSTRPKSAKSRMLSILVIGAFKFIKGSVKGLTIIPAIKYPKTGG